MPNRRKIDRPRKIELSLPTSLYAKMENALFDHEKGKVPFGAYSALYEQLIRQWLINQGIVV